MSQQLKIGRFYGKVMERSELSGVVMTELAHGKPTKHGAHTHQAPYFSMLLQGSYCEMYRSKRIEYRPMTIAFHPPATTHSDEIGTRGGYFFMVELQDECVRRLAAHSLTVESLPDLTGGKMARLAARMYSDYKSGCASALGVGSLLVEMMAEVGRLREIQERGQPQWMVSVKEMLRDTFMQQITVESLAAEVGVHPVHLSRVFRMRCGQTLGEHLNGLRVQFACDQLLEDEINLGALALDAGFADQSHFCKVFKTVTGCTPMQFRKMRLGRNTNGHAA
jgi:AraC family transcriptional regulator